MIKFINTSSINFIKLRRGTEEKLLLNDDILIENEIICTVPNEYAGTKDIEILKQPIFKYKIGNGINKWSELPYQENTIPVFLSLIPVGYDRSTFGEIRTLTSLEYSKPPENPEE